MFSLTNCKGHLPTHLIFTPHFITFNPQYTNATKTGKQGHNQMLGYLNIGLKLKHSNQVTQIIIRPKNVQKYFYCVVL